jgi:hypothetical protein
VIERITISLGLAAAITLMICIVVGSIWAVAHVAPAWAPIVLLFAIWIILVVVELASSDE